MLRHQAATLRGRLSRQPAALPVSLPPNFARQLLYRWRSYRRTRVGDGAPSWHEWRQSHRRWKSLLVRWRPVRRRLFGKVDHQVRHAIHWDGPRALLPPPQKLRMLLPKTSAPASHRFVRDPRDNLPESAASALV